MELKEYLGILKHRWEWVAGTIVVVLGLFTLLLQFQTPEYQSRAEVIIANLQQPESENISSVRYNRETLTDLFHNREWRNTAAFIFELSRVKGKPVDQLSVGPSNGKEQNWQRVRIEDVRKAIKQSGTSILEDEKKLDKQAGKFKDVKVRQGSDNKQLFRFQYTGTDRKNAPRILNAFIAAVTVHSQEKARSQYAFLEKQLSEQKNSLANQIKTLEKDKDRLLQEFHVSSLRELDRQLQEYRGELQNIRKMMRKIRIERLKNDLRQKLTLRSLAAGPTTTGQMMPLVSSKGSEKQRLQEQLDELRFQLRAEKQSKTSAHPRIKQLKAKVKSVKKQLEAAEDRSLSSSLKEQSATRQKMQLEYNEYRKRKEELSKKVDRLSRPVAELRAKNEKIENLNEQLITLRSDLTDMRQRKKAQVGPVEPKEWATEARILPGDLPVNPWAAAAIAILGGIGVAYLRDYLDNTIRTDYDVRRYLNLPIFALVREEDRAGDVLIKNHPLKAPISEIYNTGATLLQSSIKDAGGYNVVSFTSAVAREGKTSMSINIATAFARKGFRTCLVDLDFRGAKVHNHLNLPREPGVSNYLESSLREDLDPKEAKSTYRDQFEELLVPTDIDNLLVAPAGRSEETPVRLLESPYLDPLLQTFSEETDIVLVDTPPIRSVSDPLIIARVVDSTVMVVGAGMVTKQDASWAKHLLNNVRAHLMGVILNRFNRQQVSKYYYYYNYSDKNYHYGD